MNKLSIKGILIGAVTDILSTNILLIPLIIYIVVTNDFAGLAKDNIQAKIMDTLAKDNFIHMLHLAIGISCSILGGYVGARIAKHGELLNGTLTSFLCVSAGIYSLIFGKLNNPVWEHLLLLIITPLLALLGGYLRLRGIKVNEILA